MIAAAEPATGPAQQEWARLEEAAALLLDASVRAAPTEHLSELANLIEALSPLEKYWAFPGTEDHHRPKTLFAAAR